MNGYQCCCVYRALKLHFNTEYDYFKYNGRIKYSVEEYLKNPNQYVYEKLGKKYKDEELKRFLLSNFIVQSKIWVHDLLTEEACTNFSEYEKRMQSFSYRFKLDCIELYNSVDNFKDLFDVKEHSFPLLLTKTLRNDIMFETFIILNKFMDFIPVWDKKIMDDHIWPVIRHKCVKYEPFLHYDKKQFKSVFLKTIV